MCFYLRYGDTEDCMLLSAEHSAMVTEMDELDAGIYAHMHSIYFAGLNVLHVFCVCSN